MKIIKILLLTSMFISSTEPLFDFDEAQQAIISTMDEIELTVREVKNKLLETQVIEEIESTVQLAKNKLLEVNIDNANIGNWKSCRSPRNYGHYS